MEETVTAGMVSHVGGLVFAGLVILASSPYSSELLAPGGGGEEIFLPSRLALGPTQPTVKWVPGLPRG